MKQVVAEHQLVKFLQKLGAVPVREDLEQVNVKAKFNQTFTAEWYATAGGETAGQWEQNGPAALNAVWHALEEAFSPLTGYQSWSVTMFAPFHSAVRMEGTRLWVKDEADEDVIRESSEEDQAMNEAQEMAEESRPKTLINTDIQGTHQNVPDVEVYGDGDTFRLWVKAASQAEGWMKTSKVANLPRGCLVQTETQQRNPDGSYALSQALAYVPGQWLNKAMDPPEMLSYYVDTTHEKKTMQSMLEQDDEALVDAWLDAIRHGVVRGEGDEERLAFVAGWRAARENGDQL